MMKTKQQQVGDSEALYRASVAVRRKECRINLVPDIGEG